MTISINYRIPDQPGARYNTAQRGLGPVLMICAWAATALSPVTPHWIFSHFSPHFGATQPLEPDTREINFRSDAIFSRFLKYWVH